MLRDKNFRFIVMEPSSTPNRLSITGKTVQEEVSNENGWVQTVGIALVTNDDFIQDKYGIYYGSGNDSFQIRAKALYKSKNGVFFKEGTNSYLDKEQLQELNSFIECLKNSNWNSDDLDERIKQRIMRRGW